MNTPFLNIEEQLRNMKLMMIGLTAKEALWRESWDLDRKEILAEFDRIGEIVGVNDTYGNGMAAIHLKKLYGWELQEPDRARGQYFGTVVALEHHVALVKFMPTKIIELPFGAMAVTEVESPRLGDSIRMDFKNGVLTAAVVNRSHL